MDEERFTSVLLPKRYEDATLHVYMRKDRLFGWAFAIIPAIGKLQYAVYFRNSSKNLEIYNYPSKYAEPYVGRKVPVLLKLDGFWLMAYIFNGKVYFRTRTNPRVGKKSIIDKVIHGEDFPLREIENMVSDGYWPQFEVWGPGLAEYNILFGGTRVDDLALMLGYEGKFFPNVLMVMDARKMKYLPQEEARKVAESYGLTPVPYLADLGYPEKTIELTPENIIEVMKWIQKYNEEHGGARIEYSSVEYDHPILGHLEGISSTIPPKGAKALVEGAVMHVYNGMLFEGFKVKPFAVMAADTFAKKYPPYERIKIEVFKVLGDQSPEEVLLWMRDCKFAGRNEPCLGRLVNEVLDYLAEDYAIKVMENGKIKKVLPRKMVKGVWMDVRRYFADLIVTNFPEIASIDPGDMHRKYGFDARLIGYIVTMKKKEN